MQFNPAWWEDALAQARDERDRPAGRRDGGAARRGTGLRPPPLSRYLAPNAGLYYTTVSRFSAWRPARRRRADRGPIETVE